LEPTAYQLQICLGEHWLEGARLKNREEKVELTEVRFWDEYWANCKLPNEVDYNFSFERCLARALKESLPAVQGEALEIGCAPGKWLAFMAKEFGLKPNGIEYSEAGMNATMKNFQLLGLTSGSIRTGDFFHIKPDRQFDVVMSFGFIEHFSQVDTVVDLHMQWLRPGGTLILGVPNFRGIYYFLQKFLDRTILDKHNLEIMCPEYFYQLADRHQLKPIAIRYIGSFEPSLPIPSQGKNNPLQIMVRGGLWLARKVRRLKAFDAINGRSFSSYILAVYKKSENN
jgi:2-polyprenyl-3-methyl-5-hydroxy-6-metoxy-1,4-benzoquinol methylase